MYNLQIPDAIYQWAQQKAQESQQSVDDILMTYVNLITKSIPILPADEEAELAALRYLSDDALWTIARETMSDTQQQRMQVLMDKNSTGEINPAEYTELAELVVRGQQLTLRKSEAMVILTERGYSVALKDRDGRE